MKLDDVRNAIINCGNSVYFTLNGIKSGIEPTVEQSKFTFEAWHGTELRTYEDFDEMVGDKLFGGKSFVDLLNDGIQLVFL